MKKADVSIFAALVKELHKALRKVDRRFDPEVVTMAALAVVCDRRIDLRDKRVREHAANLRETLDRIVVTESSHGS